MNKIAFSSFCIFHSPSILGFCCCILCLASSKSDAQEAGRPLASVEKPPFSAGKWTHVAVVINNFNTSQTNGVAMLFLDGKKAGEISPRNQTFTWDSKKASVMLGLSYIGLMDDLALFDRALKANEIEVLYALKGGVRELTCK